MNLDNASYKCFTSPGDPGGNNNFYPSQYRLLIIDDTPTNLGVAIDYLDECGFDIITATTGKGGLNKANRLQPHLILLDVMMPDIDGFEICHRLKANPATQTIPVIFLTSLSSVEDKVKGFEAGGVDYITKPIQQEEMLARIKTHLTLQAQKAELERLYRLEEERARQLAELNATKDKFFAIIAHDLRGPFNPLLGMTELMAKTPTTIPPHDLKQMAQDIHQAANNLYNLLENLLEWSRLQQGRIKCKPELLELNYIAEQSTQLLTQNATAKGVRLQNIIPIDLSVYADKYMLTTIIRNLISNAIKFTPPDGQVTLSAHLNEDSGTLVEITVADTGVGIKPEDQVKLFRLDVHHTTQGTAYERGTGLGLIICQEMVEKNGGRIWIESQGAPGQGTTIHFTMPTSPN